MTVRDDLLSLARSLGRTAKRAAHALERVVDRDPYHVIGYRGYATPERALILGRALQNEALAPADAGHPTWQNLIDMLKRIEADPLPFARVRATIGEREHEIEADDEGFLHHWLPLEAPLGDGGWHRVRLELPLPTLPVPSRSTAHILVPAATARFGVISDMDDTVLQSEITNFLQAARLMLLENSRTRLPFPGVAAFYRALEEGDGSGTNPIFYVSGSPWNLYDVIADFLEAQKIPAGPLILRDWDIGRRLLRTADYKTAAIREIMHAYPSLPFILVGDSGQEDPEIYSALAHDHPGRILAIYIRNVTPHPERLTALNELVAEVKAAHSTLVIADDTLAAAQHAAEHGWIDAARLSEIGEEKREDEAGEEEEKGPTVVVDESS